MATTAARVTRALSTAAAAEAQDRWVARLLDQWAVLAGRADLRRFAQDRLSPTRAVAGARGRQRVLLVLVVAESVVLVLAQPVAAQRTRAEAVEVPTAVQRATAAAALS